MVNRTAFKDGTHAVPMNGADAAASPQQGRDGPVPSAGREILFKVVEPDGRTRIIYADGSTEGFDFPPGTAFCNYHPRLLAEAVVRLRREALFRSEAERARPPAVS